jgi:glycosyltransferase involved in cell wall biosynthesis
MVLNCPCPVWVCDFDPEGNKRYHSALWFSRWVHARFAGPIKRGQVVLATETEHEARELTQLVGAPVQWFNPPRPSEMVEAARSIRAGRVSAEDPFVFLWVGRLALEKGVREFMAGVARCMSENPAMPCRIWVPEPRDWQKAEISREEFAAWMGRDPRIEFAPSPASPEEDNYANLLGRADCVLLPYQRQHYIGRVSSTALDAGVTDLPVVVTAGTWMEDILGQLCSGVAVPDGDAAALAGAMADTWRQRAEAATDARRVGEVARRELSWSRFMGFVRDARAA